MSRSSHTNNTYFIENNVDLSILKMISFIFAEKDIKWKIRQNIKQLDGSAIGKPVSSVIANILMYELITSCLKELDFHIAFLKIYVKDTILAVPSNKSSDILNIFNS